MDERSFQGLPSVLGSHCILFQVPAIVSEKVYIPPALVAFFNNADVLVKALILLFTQISTVLWKIVQVWPQKVEFDLYSCSELGRISSVVLQFPSCITYSVFPASF